jgi:DNA-nicking Smr family endonuclease
MPKRKSDRPARERPADDEASFVREMGNVKRLSHNQAAIKRAIPAGPLRVHGEPVKDENRGEALRFLRPGAQQSVLQKLRRGQFPIEATLDLHGLNRDEAQSRVREFIRESVLMKRRAVRIIHGKGHGSAGHQPVLKSRVNEWLIEFPEVLAFRSSQAARGGTGSVDVLLRR